MRNTINIDGGILQYNYNDGNYKTEKIKTKMHGIYTDKLLEYLHRVLPIAPVDPDEWTFNEDSIYCLTHDMSKDYTLGLCIFLSKSITDEEMEEVGIHTNREFTEKIQEATEYRISDEKAKELENSYNDTDDLYYFLLLLYYAYERMDSEEDFKVARNIAERNLDFWFDYANLEADMMQELYIDTTRSTDWEPTSRTAYSELPTPILGVSNFKEFLKFIKNVLLQAIDDPDYEITEGQFEDLVWDFVDNKEEYVIFGEPNYDSYIG